MTVKNPKELFVLLLSDVRQNEERTAETLKQLSGVAKDPHIDEAIESHIFLRSQIIGTLDRCFSLIGEKPSKPTSRLHDVFLEDFRREVAEIQSPVAKRLYVLAKLKHLFHFRIAEYVALTAMADLSGHFGVGVMLETCLAEKLAFVDRARRLARYIVQQELQERLAA